MGQKQRANFDSLKNLLKTTYLKPYLRSCGIHADDRLFSCINPDHKDSNPSCGIIPSSNDQEFHCFGCGAVGDVFTAANMLEDKPIAGLGFITDNLIYLAGKFGLEVPDLEDLTSEEIHEIDTYQAYSHAAEIIRTSSGGDLVKARVMDLGWPQDTMKKLGVGSVTSYEDYLERMTKLYGHKLAFLKDVDLIRKDLFNSDNLIFTIKDENGAPVGFAARNLKFAQDIEAFEKNKNELVVHYGADSDNVKSLIRPSKFINSESKSKNLIYQKSKRLFNFHIAKKHTPPLYIFEGYADCVTAYCGGLRSGVAIGSTSFSQEHLDMIMSSDPPIRQMIFVLDADNAGINGTDRFVKLLESIGGRIGLRAEMVLMPEGSDDPDSFIRKFSSLEIGVKELRKLDRMDAFAWNIKQGIRLGKDPQIIADETIPLIVNEPSYIIRYDRAEKLAQQTGLPKSVIWSEVMRLVNADEAGKEEQKNLLAKRIAKELSTNPRGAQVILQSGLTQIETIDQASLGYSPQRVLAAAQIATAKAEKRTSNIGLRTGMPIFDMNLNGIPREKMFISVPGKPNQGKSSFLDNLTYRLLDNNDDCIVFYHSVDDSLDMRMARLLANRAAVPSKYFEYSGQFLHGQPIEGFDFHRMYQEQIMWLESMMEAERLIIADVGMLPATLPALESWVRSVRTKFPDHPLVVMGDNLHLFDLPGYDPGEGKTREMSKYIKRLANVYSCTTIFTTELPKEALRPGIRPRIGKIKGTSGIAYDANVNLGVYNDLKDMEHRAELFWNDQDDQERTVAPDGSFAWIPKKKPIVEIVVDKSKISSFDGCIYYRFWPESGHFEECSESEQVQYRSRAIAGKDAANDMAMGAGVARRFGGA